MIDNLEEFIVLEKRIDASEDVAAAAASESIRDRWEFGKLLLAKRVGKQLPKGLLDELVKEVGSSRAELGHRMKFAEVCPTEDKVSNALETFGSWFKITQNLSQMGDKPKPKQKPEPIKRDRAEKPGGSRDPELLEKIRERRASGKPTRPLQDEFGVHGGIITAAENYVIGEERARAELAEQQPIDWDSIPGNQRDKLERAKQSIRKQLEREAKAEITSQLNQYRAKLDADFAAHKAAYDEQNARINAMRDAERRRYQAGIEAQRSEGLIPIADYKLLIRSLHPDKHSDTCSVTKQELEAALIIITDPKFKALLVKEDKK